MVKLAFCLFVWLFVAIDRFIEFDNAAKSLKERLALAQIEGEAGLRLQVMGFCLGWPIIMTFRIGRYLYTSIKD